MQVRWNTCGERKCRNSSEAAPGKRKEARMERRSHGIPERGGDSKDATNCPARAEEPSAEAGKLEH